MENGNVGTNVMRNPEVSNSLPLAHRGNIAYWEFKVLDSTIELNGFLEIPKEYHYIFVDQSQNEIILADNDSKQTYVCDIIFTHQTNLEIVIGRGWLNYVRDVNLKAGDTLVFLLYENHPEKLHVCVVDRV
ncbi:uncharacterized protein LOC123923039 [Trifolium pratense]|uniref:uncharacterized protein LOC123923039 n=1 Tax=Trifolium pratense TaxID=57577 RepID=UPI001E693C15|nr:uncharacterized protein LOC123923039 [Trifolium pratense]